MSDHMYDKAAVGSRIREKRLAMHLTQEKVAEKLELSIRTVTDIERGIVGMSIETLLSLCDVLKVTPNDLLLPSNHSEDSELDWLVYNAPVDYVNLLLNGDIREYLKNVTDYHPLDN